MATQIAMELGEITALSTRKGLGDLTSSSFDNFGYEYSVINTGFLVSPNPKVATICLCLNDHIKDVTCPEVQISSNNVPVDVCQNLIHLSLLPPPVANKDFDQGQKAMAFTAALCGRTNFLIGLSKSEISHKLQELSLPPTASRFACSFREIPVENIC